MDILNINDMIDTLNIRNKIIKSKCFVSFIFDLCNFFIRFAPLHKIFIHERDASISIIASFR